MPQIRPIRDLKNTTEISNLCHEVREPIFITKNGYGDMVIMSMRTYEEQLARLNMYTKIMEGKSQANNGQLLDGQSTMEKLRKKYVEQV